MDLARVAPGLDEVQPGLWTARETEAVSYYDGGHAFTHAMQDDSFWYRHRTECILAAIDRFPPGGPLLDIGGGTGHVGEALTAAGHPTVLVEPGPHGARVAWERGLRPVVNATTATAGFLPGSVPAIGAFDVVEHLEDDHGFLVHLHDLLAADGMAYFTVPAHQWLWSVDDERAGHHRRYERAAFVQRLTGAGFDVLYDTQFFRPLSLPVLVVRGIPSRLGRRARDDLDVVARDHRDTAGIAGRIMAALLRPEVAAVREGTTMRHGTSILAVTRRR